jgi:hypothetical protein
MSRVMKAVPLVVLCALIIAVPSVWAYWVQDGSAICAAMGDQLMPAIVSDGAGGAIVTWVDNRSGFLDIYAQRVNASGAVQWTTDGVALCTATGNQYNPTISSDAAGGAIVTWYDERGGNNHDIYAQRVNASGTVQWTTNGVALCTAAGVQSHPQIISDGAGGAIVTWHDERSGNNYDIYAQRVNASGAVQWTVNGVALCTATSNQAFPTIMSDGAGGTIVTWHDARSGNNYDIYAQRVNASGAVQWTTDGVPLCTAMGDQQVPTITSDGAGGAIVTWHDGRSGNNYDIYAQRVNASGVVQWTTDGVAFCTATGNQYYPTISSDAAGGTIVTWYDERGGTWDIYAQRVNASGAVQWTTDGVALCTAAGAQQHPQITSDGAGGAIVTWYDERGGSNSDIYAQRVNASGAVQWTTDGVALCTATGVQWYSRITSDGAGGTIVTWWDNRGGNWDIYAQGIDGHGRVGFLGPDILSVQDVPGDQGGWLRLTIDRSRLDDELEAAYPIATYNVWQRIDNPALLAMVSRGSGGAPGALMSEAPPRRSIDMPSISGWPVRELNGRHFVQSKELLTAAALPPGTWELLGNFAACQQDQYIYRASTLADSTASGIPYSVYIVSAHTTTPSVWFMSEPDSGYSVDNLPPGAPVGLVAEQSYTPAGLALSWNVSAENDLSYYAVYRGLSEDFVPGHGNRVTTPTQPEWFDGSWRWNSGYYYKISAVDVHGNESGFALLRPDNVTGVETPKAPEATYLTQNFPNPFNPTTRITFGLSAPGYVSLRIYDAAGRLVRVLVNNERHAARYEETWDGRDSSGRAVASGIYFYRLDAGAFAETKKMVLAR